jgi:hypothetical protein
MDANDLPSAAVHLAERRDKRGMLLSCWLVARCEDALGRAGRTQPGNLYISSTAMCPAKETLPTTEGRECFSISYLVAGQPPSRCDARTRRWRGVGPAIRILGLRRRTGGRRAAYAADRHPRRGQCRGGALDPLKSFKVGEGPFTILLAKDGSVGPG